MANEQPSPRLQEVSPYTEDVDNGANISREDLRPVMAGSPVDNGIEFTNSPIAHQMQHVSQAPFDGDQAVDLNSDVTSGFTELDSQLRVPVHDDNLFSLGPPWTYEPGHHSYHSVTPQDEDSIYGPYQSNSNSVHGSSSMHGSPSRIHGSNSFDTSHSFGLPSSAQPANFYQHAAQYHQSNEPGIHPVFGFHPTSGIGPSNGFDPKSSNGIGLPHGFGLPTSRPIPTIGGNHSSRFHPSQSLYGDFQAPEFGAARPRDEDLPVLNPGNGASYRVEDTQNNGHIAQAAQSEEASPEGGQLGYQEGQPQATAPAQEMTKKLRARWTEAELARLNYLLSVEPRRTDDEIGDELGKSGNAVYLKRKRGAGAFGDAHAAHKKKRQQ